ncbi:hypothetical protein GALL_277100 [mine drainage metagenome]|uniref:Glycosyl transferase family 8 n=1 Tax=mine drainage metagenome TaxID=410659 RepID=A0A1J5RE28_9ZZZZ
MKKCIFTVCACNYLSQALCLAESVEVIHSEVDFYIYIVDRPVTEGAMPRSNEIRFCDELGILGYEQLAFKYTVIEFSTAVKPFIFQRLFENDGYDSVIYLDPDIVLFDRLDEAFSKLENAAIVLTPHFLTLEEKYTGCVPLTEILWVGAYNCGFVALSGGSRGRSIARWWACRLYDQGYADKIEGLHVDQKWMDLLDCVIPNDWLHVLRNVGYNVAFWNLHERRLVMRGKKYYVAGRLGLIQNEILPMVFFHFSGFNPNNLSILHKRHPQYNIENFPEYEPLMLEYAEAILRNRYNLYSALEYRYNYFDNGAPIYQFYRRLYRSMLNMPNIDTRAPFRTNTADSVYNAFVSNRLLIQKKGSAITHSSIGKTEISKKKKYLELVFKLMHWVLGARNYFYLTKVMEHYGRPEAHSFLLKRQN